MRPVWAKTSAGCCRRRKGADWWAPRRAGRGSPCCRSSPVAAAVGRAGGSNGAAAGLQGGAPAEVQAGTRFGRWELCTATQKQEKLGDYQNTGKYSSKILYLINHRL